MSRVASRGSVVKLRSSPNTAQLSSAEVGILPRLPDTKDEIEEILKLLIYLINPVNQESASVIDLMNKFNSGQKKMD